VSLVWVVVIVSTSLAAGRWIRGFAEHGDIRSVRRALGVISVLLVMAVVGLWWALHRPL
jgi:hypothetical protein